MRFKAVLCVAMSLATFLTGFAWTPSAQAKAVTKAVAKDPLAVRKPKSKAATKSTGLGSKYLRVKNNSSQNKKKK